MTKLAIHGGTTTNRKLLAWVEEIATLCKPDKIHWCDGSQAEYDSYINSAVKTDLGRSEFTGVCATCHGMQGQGGYGPALATNSLLTQAAGLESIVRAGRGRMPAVGDGWTKEQMQALLAYVKKSVYKGAAASGG